MSFLLLCLPLLLVVIYLFSELLLFLGDDIGVFLGFLEQDFVHFLLLLSVQLVYLHHSFRFSLFPLLASDSQLFKRHFCLLLDLRFPLLALSFKQFGFRPILGFLHSLLLLLLIDEIHLVVKLLHNPLQIFLLLSNDPVDIHLVGCQP